eukprot:3933897-Rhodomonas_salina.9
MLPGTQDCGRCLCRLHADLVVAGPYVSTGHRYRTSRSPYISTAHGLAISEHENADPTSPLPSPPPPPSPSPSPPAGSSSSSSSSWSHQPLRQSRTPQREGEGERESARGRESERDVLDKLQRRQPQTVFLIAAYYLGRICRIWGRGFVRCRQRSPNAEKHSVSNLCTAIPDILTMGYVSTGSRIASLSAGYPVAGHWTARSSGVGCYLEAVRAEPAGDVEQHIISPWSQRQYRTFRSEPGSLHLVGAYAASVVAQARA